MLLTDLKLRLFVILIIIGFCISDAALEAAAAGGGADEPAVGIRVQRRAEPTDTAGAESASAYPHTDFEIWMRENTDYGTIPLLTLRMYERKVLSLGGECLEFYMEMARDLSNDSEFRKFNQSVVKKGLIYDIIGEAADLTGKVGCIVIGGYLYTTLTASAKDCGPCFASHDINSATQNCTACYTDVTNTNTTWWPFVGRNRFDSS